MVDWLIIAEKQSQADKIIEGLCDTGVRVTGDYKMNGKGGKGVSSILPGEIRVMRFKGHAYEMEYPDKQDPDKYSFKETTTVNKFGMEVSTGRKSYQDIFNNYPIELDLDRVKMKVKTRELGTVSKTLKTLYKEAKHVVVATDYDNEGEMIYINWQTKNIPKPEWDKMYRVKLNDLTPSAVQSAFNNLIHYPSDPYLVSMRARGYARAISDYEYGLSFSHYGFQYANAFGAPKGQWGRLKNALLGVIYKQEKAYNDYKEVVNYRVDMVLPNGEKLQGDDSLVFKTKQEAEDYIKNGGLNKTVDLKYSEKEVVKRPDKLYSRNELIVALSKKNNGKDWNKPLQSLYERHALLSYPRTDVQYISKETYENLKDLAKTRTIQLMMDDVINENAKKNGISVDTMIDVNTPPQKAYVDESKLDGESHYALIPTEKEPRNFDRLSPDEKVVYMEDMLHTMAIFCNPSVSFRRDYRAGDRFKGTQSRIAVYGYRLLTGDCPKNKDTFPDEGQYEVTYTISDVKSKRPSLFTEASLLSMMKKVNWGTSATRDSTIHDMIKKRSIKVEKGKLKVNPGLYDTVEKFVEDYKLIDFEMTSRWQTELDALKTENDALDFINKNRQDTRSVHDQFKSILKY